ncbi:PREDICTED: uncharacterized protein LOC109581697 isoform X1 [Amphimedon queenslandica]|uniref:Ig-like domain-containing protein n=1 Tax=Amphimedon queenslandica TaxID=400682 RepID=A0AAN0J3H9_AMPQE|nr:PREDICTED: uncharacterized protein LOC109581697 isoform X1 [Amphimedon queenslandica]|eukprot:XP_019851570.1 PREDICTED: uncharacterized protein LOC109581697 isoform X1 [Amphimedon queenslandica]
MVLLKFIVLFLGILVYSVDSCSTVSRSGVSLTGVCPNDTFTVPIGTTLTYNCSASSFTSGYQPYWNISGISYAPFDPTPPSVTIDTNIPDSLSFLHITINVTQLLDIQCRLCMNSNCFGNDSTKLIVFGPPSSLSHELRENAKLSWSAPSLPPSVNEDDVSFTYNIIIMGSTNNSLTVTDINITNNTYVIISPANITNYTECTSYQWGVRAAADLSYGFTDFENKTESFTFTSAPNITDATVTGSISSIIFELIFSTSVEDAYTYTLHQRDYCENQLNSSEINNTLISRINNTMVSINIQSLIEDETWSVSVEVAVCQYNDTTQYINITNGSDTDRILDCKSDSLVSSTAITSLTLLPSISSMEHTSFFVSPSFPSSSVTNTPSGTCNLISLFYLLFVFLISGTPVSGKSINIIIGGVTGGVIGGIVVLILIVAVLTACKIKKKGSFTHKK